LYAQGEDLHVSVWPGGLHNTRDLPSFIAKESRSYVLAVCGLMRKTDLPDDAPERDTLLTNSGGDLANGGTAIAAPVRSILVEPIVGRVVLIVAELDHALVRGERQSFDVAGHYARPDVTRLIVDRARQKIAEFRDE
jgi:nitrilase